MATRISSKLVFTGRVFRVERDRVTLPHGRVVTMDVVRHRGSVVLVPQPSPREVILIRQYRYVIDRWIWELPAGSLEEGESPLRAARRECVEEIGLRPAIVERLGEYVPTPGFCDERMVFYRCAELAAPRRRGPLDPDEQIEPKVFTLRQTWDLVRRGEIVDMKTILGLGMISGKVPVQRRGT